MSRTQETYLPVKPTVSRFPNWVYKSNYRIVTMENVREALKEIVDAEVVSWDSEYESTPGGHIVSAFSFSTKYNTGWLLPVGMHHLENISFDVAKRFIYAISKKRNVVQSGWAEMATVHDTWPEEAENLLNITDDVQVIWYLKDPNEAKDFKDDAPRRRGGSQPQGFSLTQMALKYLKLEVPDLGDYFKAGHTFAELDPEIARLYACSDADITLRLFHKGMDPALRNSFIYKIDMQCIQILFEMRRRGIEFDENRMAEVEEKAREAVKIAREEVYEALKCDPSVNIDSSTQLRRHIFNVLQWPIVGKKTKDGLGSVDKNSMGRWMESPDPSISKPAQAIARYRKLHTLHNNFLTKLSDYKNPVTGAIHASFLSTVVPTGRLACASPNMQQIPTRDDKFPLRRAFRARKGYVFVEADYSQIELRVYAGESQEQFFFDSFLNGIDLHLKTASVIFREEIVDKKDPRRSMGKTMNFGPIYGMKAQGLAMRTDYSLMEAERILDDFFGAMPDAVRWTQDVHSDARTKGGVHTHFGRWRPLPWLRSRIPQEVEFGERSAINTIVQGTAADIMKIGLIRLWKALRKYKLDAHLVLTIHDNVLLEVAESIDLKWFVGFLREQLCFKIEGYPPLEIDVKVGRNWHDMEDFDDDLEVAEDDHDTVVNKELMLPVLTDGQKAKLIELLRNVPPGNIMLTIQDQTGKVLTPEPLAMNDSNYKHILQYVVSAARQNMASIPSGGQVAPEIPKVAFV